MNVFASSRSVDGRTLFETAPSATPRAVISPCGKYRYSLWRDLGGHSPFAVFIMLNPSTADAERDDPTIRRCMGFAKSWGCGKLFVLNLFAIRATDPDDMLAADDPEGPDNWEHFRRRFDLGATEDPPIIAAIAGMWGAR